ncbi:MAG: pyruvate dehydrogenase (acetyl-transferring) E1 component subunit alpha [Chloroflexi bacterium]|nr:pyruvate dehydrogenase (acetyl-transferring) E1 component subunit alpha [Chloroflexota bacterium]
MERKSRTVVPKERVDALGTREQLLRYLKLMVLIRRFEEKAGEMYLRAKIGGYLHLNIGEEGTVVGSVSALEERDYLYTSYRDHGYAIARGVNPKAVMAELFGKATGCSQGRGGSMHLFDARVHFLGGYGIVAAHIPVATGTALAATYRGTDEVTMCIFGEGATNIGAFHEGLNVAKLWRLPVVFVCTNNIYGMGTAVNRASAVSEIYRKACAYDIAAERVDGMDVLAVRDACLRGVERARKESEPTLIETMTYRYRGHSMADPARYRSEAEVRWWRERDPILTLETKLKEQGMVTQEEMDDIEANVERVVEESVEFADRSPAPSLDDLYKNVYAESEGR